MTLKRPSWGSGTLVVLEHDSTILRDNPLGDPHVRKLTVWLPPQYNEGATRGKGRRFPVLYDMVGFMGAGPAHTSWKAFTENIPERAARLIHDKAMGPAIFVHQLLCAGKLRRLHQPGARALRRSRVPHARLARSSWLLR
jgi:hypothetical protein